MNIILLSGGSGKRLWPLSNDIRSKQFLKIFKKLDGTKESMIQRMYRMIKEVDKDATITVATSENQVSQIKSQLGENIAISVEPTRKDTFPAIALAVAYLHKLGVNPNESVIICPVDSYVEYDYFEHLKLLNEENKKTNGITLMGIEPTHPSESYGYIIPLSSAAISPVKEFKEKPNQKIAEEYIKKGALWNAGVFAFKLSYLLSKTRSILGTDDYDELYKEYNEIEKISFDYAIVEKEKNTHVLRFNGFWKDIGTWNMLTEVMNEAVSGNTTIKDCINTHVINELNIPLVVLGIRNCVIAATPDGILFSEKGASTQLKSILEQQKYDNRPMYEQRNWGEYKVLDYKKHGDNRNSLVKELIIEKGKHISYQRHKHRTEIWTFTEGNGELIIDGIFTKVTRGDVVVINAGTKHAIKGLSELHIIEVQIGEELTEDDIERLDWNW